MTSYRFCRPDDIPRLVAAVDACFGVHFPGEPPMTVERFRTEMKELGVWPSNSMLAVDGGEPVAVMIGTKREREVRVLRLGARPGHERRGHGRHMLTSLSQKLAVLGPPRLVVELPAALAHLGPFLERCGYEREALYTDYLRPAGGAEPVPEEWVIPTSVGELADNDVLEAPEDVAWDRQLESLEGRREALQGLAVASPERIEAYVLYLEGGAAGTFLDVLAARALDPERAELFLGLLLRALAGRSSVPLRLPRLSAGELPAGLLEQLGFEAGERTERWAAQATPA